MSDGVSLEGWCWVYGNLDAINMNPKPLVSIIFPVYNVEDYIEQSIQSVLTQSYQNIELIVIDDCGNDKSVSIAKEVCKGSENVRMLHHDRNRGLSIARNYGLEVAEGEWIFFMDSDDLLDKDCISVLVSLAERHPDAEIIVGQYDEFLPGEAPHPARWRQQTGVYQGDVIGPYVEEKIPATVWNKLVRRDFLLNNQVLFVERLVHEDALWSAQVACLAHNVVVADAITYHYLQRSGSLDKKKDANYHAIHYNLVYCLLSSFVFDHGLQNDDRLFRFIEKRRYQLLTDACMSDARIARALYHETRQYPYWKQWHRFLPEFLAFFTYIQLRCWYLRTIKGF